VSKNAIRGRPLPKPTKGYDNEQVKIPPAPAAFKMKWHTLGGKVALSLGAPCIVLLAAELPIRGLNYEPKPLVSRAALVPREGKVVRFITDPDCRGNWLMAPNQQRLKRRRGLVFATDGAGWRSPERKLPYLPLHRILLLGDSCTFGWGVKSSETYGRRLEEMLGDLRVEVINRRVPGYSSLQGVHLLSQHLSAEPFDVAIVSYGWNDANER